MHRFTFHWIERHQLMTLTAADFTQMSLLIALLSPRANEVTLSRLEHVLYHGTKILVARDTMDEDRIVAMATLTIEEGVMGRRARILEACVEASRSGKGIARDGLKHLIDRARHHEASSLVPDHALVQLVPGDFLKRIGFKERGDGTIYIGLTSHP